MNNEAKTIDLSTCEFHVGTNDDGSGVCCCVLENGEEMGIYIEILKGRPIPSFFSAETRVAISAQFAEYDYRQNKNNNQ